MRKPLLGLVGVVTIVLARQIATVGELAAFRNPREAARRPTTIPIARLEGLLAVAIARRGRWPTALVLPMGLAGAAMLFVPRAALRFGLVLAYRNPDRIEPRTWVGPATRVAGLCHVLLALSVLRKR